MENRKLNLVICLWPDGQAGEVANFYISTFKKLVDTALAADFVLRAAAPEV